MAERYLGRKLAFKDTSRVELENRINAAWAAFHKHKQELCCKHYCLKDRCRLFDATVTPTLLYGCATWALTCKMEEALQAHWRRMLRYVFGLHCRSTETWVEYVQRSAHDVERMAEKFRLQRWTVECRVRKWRFAGRLARHEDGRWSSQILSWTPCNGAGRGRGWPKTRWSDDLCKLAGEAWIEHAKDSELWQQLEEGFVERR